MSSMLDSQKYNADMRERQIDLTIKSMGPTNEKSAFLLAVLAKQSADPTAFFNDISKYIDTVYAAGENTDTSVESTFAAMQNLSMTARQIFQKIKDI